MTMMWVGIAGIAAGTGASIYGTSQANKNAKKLRDQNQPFVDQQTANSKFLAPWGQQQMNAGNQNMSALQNLLYGQINSRQSAMEANAPLINQMVGAQQGAVQAQRSLYPRGGQTASQASNLPYQLQGNISNTLFGARQNAMGQLGQLGANQASLGLGAMGQGAGLTNNMLNYGLNAQQQMFGQGMQIGQGISSLTGPLLQYYMMNRGTGTQTPYMPMNPGSNPNNYSGPGLYGSNTSPSGSFPTYGGVSNSIGGSSYLGTKSS